MPSIFDDVVLPWRGKTYTIPADRVMDAIGAIEERVTFIELTGWQQDPTKIHLKRLCEAYADALRIAGVSVSREDVYEDAFSDGQNSMRAIIGAIGFMLSMMIPQSAIRKATAASGKPEDAKKKTSSSSNRRTRRASAKGG